MTSNIDSLTYVWCDRTTQTQLLKFPYPLSDSPKCDQHGQKSIFLRILENYASYDSFDVFYVFCSTNYPRVSIFREKFPIFLAEDNVCGARLQLTGETLGPHMGKIDPKRPKIENFQKVYFGLKTPVKSIFCIKKAF